jgi:hypothetical protein
MKDLCRHLKKSSSYVRTWFDRQPAVKEESLTDWLLFDVSARLKNVLYHSFTRHEEAKETGADWEWWFVFRHGAERFRVQAKKLTPAGDNYAGLVHTNKHGLQIDKLLSSAKESEAIPLYALYSAVRGFAMCCGPIEGHQDGVFLAGAQNVYNKFIAGPRRQVTAADILSLSNPFSCFACCPLITDGGGLKRYLEQYYASELEAHATDDAAPFTGFHAELPSYLTSFLEYDREQLPSWWESEFRTAIQDFNALLVYDLRDHAPNAVSRCARAWDRTSLRTLGTRPISGLAPFTFSLFATDGRDGR